VKRVPSQRYLYVRGDTYYFRRGVPRDTRHAFGGKPDDWKSPDTSDLAVARTRLQREIEAFETRVAEARNELAPAKVAHAPYAPSNAEIAAAVREAHKHRKERVRPINKADQRVVDEARRRLGDLKQFKRDLERSRQITSDFHVMDVQWQAEALCQRHNWLLDEAGDQWWALSPAAHPSHPGRRGWPGSKLFSRAPTKRLWLLSSRPSSRHRSALMCQSSTPKRQTPETRLPPSDPRPVRCGQA